MFSLTVLSIFHSFDRFEFLATSSCNIDTSYFLFKWLCERMNECVYFVLAFIQPYPDFGLFPLHSLFFIASLATCYLSIVYIRGYLAFYKSARHWNLSYKNKILLKIIKLSCYERVFHFFDFFFFHSFPFLLLLSVHRATLYLHC